MARLNAQQRTERHSRRLANAGAALGRAEEAWSGMGRAMRRLHGLEVGLLPALGDLMYESIVNGSPLTGAPGQPEAEGDLKESWELEVTETSASVTTDSPYALKNEDGVREGGKPYVQHSATGGRHSLKLTRRSMQRLVERAAQMAMAGAVP
jgi:hypothetical protein